MTRVSGMEKQKAGAQMSFFGSMIAEQKIDVVFPNIPEFETMEKLSKEKSVLGVYVSGHPFEKFLPYFKDCSFNCSMLNEYTEDEETGERTYSDIRDEQPATMGGMISAFKKLQTRSGQFMAFITVEDMYGSVECVCFPKVYDKIKDFMEADRVVSLSGKISVNDDKAPSIIVDKMSEFTLDNPVVYTAERSSSYAPRNPADSPRVKEPAPQKRTEPAASADKPNKPTRLWLNVSGMEQADEEELMDAFKYYPGDTEVVFVRDGKGMLCSERVNPNKALMAELALFLPENCIKLA
jgi:DNA polymerase III alpha subunit